jgi:hypothetical protein
MLAAVPAAVVIDLAGDKVYVLKFLVPLCLPVNQEQHGNGLLPQEITIKLGVHFAIKAVAAFRVPGVDCNFAGKSHKNAYPAHYLSVPPAQFPGACALLLHPEHVDLAAVQPILQLVVGRLQVMLAC